MPSTTPELRAKFPDGDHEAQQVLRDGGYRLTRGWEWVHPLDKLPTERERDAIVYLIEEWDFGGLISTTELQPSSPDKGAKHGGAG